MDHEGKCPMKLADLIDGMQVSGITGDTGIEVTGITKDSRKAGEGCMFFSTDMNERYIEDARRKGAGVLVSESAAKTPFPCSVITDDPKALLGNVASKYYGYPSRTLHVIGITGTNGKTTTSYLIDSMLRSAGKSAGLIGTIAYKYGGRTIKAENTTPGSDDLHKLLHDMKMSGGEYVVMEVSSHALDQKRVEAVDFDTAIFTNLTHDHLDYHGTMENYRIAKKLFFTYYLKKSAKKEKYAILNADESGWQELVPEPPIGKLCYSLKKDADGCLTRYEEDIDGLKLEVSLMGTKMPMKSSLIGIFNASNILAASLAGLAAGLSHEQVVKGVESLEGVPGRLERVKTEKEIPVFIDYAHTPDALKKVLEMLNSLKKGKLIVVFGCGGDRDKAKRPVMGNIASNYADYTIITSDNPRSEDPLKIIEDIKKGFDGNSYRIVENRRDAISEGIRIQGSDDVLLIAGKGHEDYQIIGNTVLHFSDREVVEELIGVAR
jgi:UDP-N-acetylmuramoyl-L-alanyl-D-glutamate--2,6-diaminopimelate ligase